MIKKFLFWYETHLHHHFIIRMSVWMRDRWANNGWIQSICIKWIALESVRNVVVILSTTVIIVSSTPPTSVFNLPANKLNHSKNQLPALNTHFVWNAFHPSFPFLGWIRFTCLRLQINHIFSHSWISNSLLDHLCLETRSQAHHLSRLATLAT
jgi:hypothetical protein